MTTPRIEEMTGEKVRDSLSFIENLSGKEIVELENAIDEALIKAHQAGIDEAVDMIKQNVVGKFGVEQMIALDDTIKALQDNK